MLPFFARGSLAAFASASTAGFVVRGLSSSTPGASALKKELTELIPVEQVRGGELLFSEEF